MPYEDDDSGLPGSPHIIRWRTSTLATIEEEEEVLAVLRVAPGAVPDYTILGDVPTIEARALVYRSLVWALEEYERRLGSGGQEAD